jgi:hypothetical protein
MTWNLSTSLFAAGIGQLCVLVASALVPIRLNWKTCLAGLPGLVRQLFWIYGGYVVLSIISLALICLINADELASGGMLARSVCVYGAVFWGIRLTLQPALDANPFLTRWWLKTGYHLLSLLFAGFTAVFIWAALH